MKLTKKISAVVLAVLMIVVAVFAGCSSKGGNDKKADEPATSAAKVKVVDIELSSEEYAFGVDKKQPELKEKCNELLKEMKSSGELEEISNHFFGDGEPVAVTSAKQDNSKDQLVVATNAEFAPFEYKEGDKFYGIDMEIAKLLADKLGKELVIVDMAFDAVLLSVQLFLSEALSALLLILSVPFSALCVPFFPRLPDRPLLRSASVKSRGSEVRRRSRWCGRRNDW